MIGLKFSLLRLEERGMGYENAVAKARHFTGII